MNEEIRLTQALSMDLLRAAIGLNRKSEKMAATFNKESEERIKQLGDSSTNDYLNKLIKQTKKELGLSKVNADNLLMYSVLFKNHTLNQMKKLRIH
jgi:hypothetical protein